MFEYKVIDNFLDEKDFNYLNKLKLEQISKNQIKVYQNKIYNNGKIISDCFSNDFTKLLADKYNRKALEILKELSPKKISLWEYTDFNIILTGSECSFPIHRDTPNKLLSGVIYLYPKNNTGTILYSNGKGDDPTTIEWKQNRALFFSRNEKNSFHSYKGDGISNRLALVYNLCTTDIKKVCEVDDVSFLKVKLREKFNPYFYRLFNRFL
ncbi:MAG: hypothetical protein CL687_02890 [Candidatus Pelagibacter sp.]|nr:hypothetical protein [Candidatus Pelagibacter sp.]